jgi:hypothetical protein
MMRLPIGIRRVPGVDVETSQVWAVWPHTQEVPPKPAHINRYRVTHDAQVSFGTGLHRTCQGKRFPRKTGLPLSASDLTGVASFAWRSTGADANARASSHPGHSDVCTPAKFTIALHVS